MTRAEAISQHIAKRVLANTRRRFSTLYADALQEIQMATPTTSQDNSKNLNGTTARGTAADGKKFDNASVQNSQLSPVTVKYVDANEFDGDRGGDTRSQAAQPAAVPQPAPRDTTGTKGA
jgi:hypothetical protein